MASNKPVKLSSLQVSRSLTLDPSQPFILPKSGSVQPQPTSKSHQKVILTPVQADAHPGTQRQTKKSAENIERGNFLFAHTSEKMQRGHGSIT